MYHPGTGLRHLVCCTESYLMHTHFGYEFKIHWQLYGILFSCSFFSLISLIFSIAQRSCVLVISLVNQEFKVFFLCVLSQTSLIWLCICDQVAGKRERETEKDRDRQRQTQRHTDRNRETQKDRDRDTERTAGFSSPPQSLGYSSFYNREGLSFLRVLSASLPGAAALLQSCSTRNGGCL